MALPPVFKFVSCCDGYEVWFSYNGNLLGLISGSVYKNIGSSFVGYGGTIQEDKCYTVFIVDGNLSPTPVLPIIPGTANLYGPGTDCGPSELCPPCTEYAKATFYACCDNSVGISFQGDDFISVGGVIQFTETDILNGQGGALVPYRCYTVEITYVSEQEYSDLVSLKSDSFNTEYAEECGDPPLDPLAPPCASCVNYYKIINCTNSEEYYCTTSNLADYIDPNTVIAVTVSQYPNKCFYVEEAQECANPVTITVLTNVVSCEKCQLGLVVYYKLIDCNNDQIIVYTSTDLSSQIGKYITLTEYGDECFYVSVYEGLVPSDTPVTVDVEYDTCEACSLPRYLLSDCAGILNDVITNTDLSAYVGNVVTIDTCPDVCWQVQETDLSALDGDVYITANFDNCEECLSQLPLKCVSFTNTDAQAIDVYVINSDGIESILPIAGESTSAKECYISWIITNSKVTATEYGNCINGLCPPEPSRPRRRVTPGYDTPACTPEYYENVECHFSEWMYKDVLEQRYGISNCCPEELMKWEIKHEMLMLDALINPDYDCAPDNTCCPPTSTSCNSCGCSSCNCNC